MRSFQPSPRRTAARRSGLDCTSRSACHSASGVPHPVAGGGTPSRVRKGALVATAPSSAAAASSWPVSDPPHARTSSSSSRRAPPPRVRSACSPRTIRCASRRGTRTTISSTRMSSLLSYRRRKTSAGSRSHPVKRWCTSMSIGHPGRNRVTACEGKTRSSSSTARTRHPWSCNAATTRVAPVGSTITSRSEGSRAGRSP